VGVDPLLDDDAEAVAEALVGEDVAAIVPSLLRRVPQPAGLLANRGIERGASPTPVGPLRMGLLGAHRGRDRRTMVTSADDGTGRRWIDGLTGRN
jgi:hypothetical protein